jgi:protein-S-isoprenylcysteine O-methyltransferase Ste14
VHIGKYWSGTVALKEGHRLVSTGPYSLVRHPIYTGLLAAVLGSAIAAGTWEAFLGFAVMIPAYIIKWRREERLLEGEFGQEYRDYMKKTKAIVPYIV